jgi:glycosyltransferase involved in cell wall biosynthesis
VAAARNTGVQNSKGEYIAFLDDDDEWLPNKLQRQVDLLDSSPLIVGVVYTGFLKMDRATRKILFRGVPTKRGKIIQDLIMENCVVTPSVLVRKECFQKVGMFDESISYGEDWDMWIRISKEFQFEYISDFLVNYYIHDQNLSTNYELKIQGAEVIIEKYEQFFALDKKNHSAWYHRLGIFYCLTGKTSKGKAALLKAIRLYPFDVRYYFRLALALIGPKNFMRGHEFRERITNRIKCCGLYSDQNREPSKKCH